MADASSDQSAGIQSFQEFFRNMSTSYSNQTGGSTRRLFELLLPELDPIQNDSIIHDNASGPIIAAQAIMQHTNTKPTIHATDLSQAMVDAGTGLAETNGWDNVKVEVMNSTKLDFPDAMFTHSIMNLSIQNIDDPKGAGNADSLKAIEEMFRTLKPGGQVVVTTWKRFAPGEIVRGAQGRVRPGERGMPLPHEELYDGGAVKRLIVEAGFGSEEVRIVERSVVVREKEGVQGLRELMAGPMITGPALRGWTDEERGRWQGVLDEALAEEVERHGGVLFECIAVIGRK